MKTKEKDIKKIVKGLGVICICCMFWVLGARGTAASKITISHSTLTLELGHTRKLTLKNLPAKGTVQWETGNQFAATVTKDGTVQARNYGVAVIKATYAGKAYVCTVTIPDSFRRVVLDIKNASLAEGQTLQLHARAETTISYFSENSDIVTVDGTGLIKAKNPGKTVIIASTSTGYAQCNVSVTEGCKVQSKPVSKKKTAIRRYSSKNKPVYDYICWTKGKNIRFVIANLDEAQVAKVTWKTGNKKLLSKPRKDKAGKLVAKAQTISKGKTEITAIVKFKNGSKKKYRSVVRVTAPRVNTKNISIFKPIVSGKDWRQYISVTGISKRSNIQWGEYDHKLISCKSYYGKRSLIARKAGKGTMKIRVDGKTFKIKYRTYVPKIKNIESILTQGDVKKIKITGIQGVPLVYTTQDINLLEVRVDGTMIAKKSGVLHIGVAFGNVVYPFRQEIAAKGILTIVERAGYIVNYWIYSQSKRLTDGYYDCSSLVWKGYQAYNNYQTKLSNTTLPLCAADLFDYLNAKRQIVYYGYVGLDNMKPGDLIFYGDYDNAVLYSTPGRTLNIYHVAIYAGNGVIVEKGGKTLDDKGAKYIVGIGRVVD